VNVLQKGTVSVNYAIIGKTSLIWKEWMFRDQKSLLT